jgi:transcription elongation factor Elf1
MAFVSDVIKTNVRYGLRAILIPNKKLVMLFTCPECKKLKMTKFKFKGRGVKSQCVCGYVHYSSSWKY